MKKKYTVTINGKQCWSNDYSELSDMADAQCKKFRKENGGVGLLSIRKNGNGDNCYGVLVADFDYRIVCVISKTG